MQSASFIKDLGIINKPPHEIQKEDGWEEKGGHVTERSSGTFLGKVVSKLSFCSDCFHWMEH